MATNDFELNWDADESDDSGSSGGGQTGKIEFRLKDAYSLGPRDDMLAPSEVKRLMTVHYESHKQLVIKAKQLMADRTARKDGKLTGHYGNQFGLAGGGEASRFKKHPISDKFSGIRDQKVAPMPSDYIANTNEELADRLENRLENRLQNKLANRPSNAPTLRRT